MECPLCFGRSFRSRFFGAVGHRYPLVSGDVLSPLPVPVRGLEAYFSLDYPFIRSVYEPMFVKSTVVHLD